MKKYIALLLALSILTITGCGNRQNYGSNSSTVAEESSQVDVSSRIASSASETPMNENHVLVSCGLKETLKAIVFFIYF